MLRGVVILIMLPGILQAVPPAGFQNGDFSSGLSGWTSAFVDATGLTNSPTPQAGVDAGNGMLVTPSQTVGRVSLSQTFVVPSDAENVAIDVRFEHTGADPQEGAGGFPDHFQVSLLDSANASLDRRMIAFNQTGPYVPDALEPTSLQTLGNGWYRFSTNVSALAGTTTTLYLDLDDERDGFDSSVRVDGIQITTQEEPPTNVLDRPLTQDWVLSRQSGTMFGRLHLHNTEPPGGWSLTGPCRLLLRPTNDMYLMKTNGVLPDGRQFLDMTAAFNQATGDGFLSPGETATIEYIEVYMRYRTAPPDAAFEFEGQIVREVEQPE